MDPADVFTSPGVSMNDPQRRGHAATAFRSGRGLHSQSLLNEIKGGGLGQLNVSFKPLPDKFGWFFTPIK